MPAAVSLIVGLAALIIGAEVLVRFGTLLARRLHISPIIIGLTIVSIGTSAPELAVGIDGVRRGAASLVLGNIIGTNVVNIMLILGLSAAIRPILIRDRTMRLDLPFMIVSAILLWALSADGYLSMVDGMILLAVAIIYMTVIVVTARHGGPDNSEYLEMLEHGIAPPAAVAAAGSSSVSSDDDGGATAGGPAAADDGDGPLPRDWKLIVRDLFLLVASIAVVVVGADLMVNGAVEIAEFFGVSEMIIGLTIVAIGTSAPELATTLMATIRGKRSIAIGNLIGSSTLNLTFILGLSVLFGNYRVPVDRALLQINLPVMVAASVLCLPIFLTGRRIRRLEGGFMVLGYLAYLTFLITTAL